MPPPAACTDMVIQSDVDKLVLEVKRGCSCLPIKFDGDCLLLLMFDGNIQYEQIQQQQGIVGKESDNRLVTFLVYLMKLCLVYSHHEMRFTRRHSDVKSTKTYKTFGNERTPPPSHRFLFHYFFCFLCVLSPT